MIIKTSDPKSIKPVLDKFHIPPKMSHKGQNGKVLIVGGSSLFHSASIWAAEVASHIVDMVHYSSTQENNEIFLSLKKKFHNGIVVPQKHLEDYVKEDDAILIGPGMIRGNKITNVKLQTTNQLQNPNFKKIIKLEDEAEYTYNLTKYLIENYPEKKFVFDAGALQMMDKEWLLKLKTPAIVTPHQKEFEDLFGISIVDKTQEEKIQIVAETAKKYNCIILLKAIEDFVTDGSHVYIIEGGNQGLTKGGTGDVLAGLTVSFFTKNDPLTSSVLASFVLKKTADELMLKKGIWYNIGDIIKMISGLLRNLFFDRILT